jgi:ketosteroid isomerase-like protein
MLAAYAMLDFQTLTNIYADDFTYISNDGSTMTKARVVEMVRTAAFRVDSITVSDSRLRLYGTTAIITGIRRFYRAGKMLAEARYTEVWLNRNKRWQCVSGQLTPILDKK